MSLALPSAIASSPTRAEGGSTFQNGDVHFGLGQDGAPADVTALDGGDVVESNVFAMDAGFENNPVQMSDTTSALVTDNTVNYPTNNGAGVDDNALSALWFPGFDQGATISDNTLNGGGIDSDALATFTTINTADPKSGIKIIDADVNGNYGNGCSDQTITNNTISGFVYDISVISTDYTAGGAAPYVVGSIDFHAANNNVSNAWIYGIYISADSTSGTISGSVASNTDSEGYTADLTPLANTTSSTLPATRLEIRGPPTAVTGRPTLRASMKCPQQQLRHPRPPPRSPEAAVVVGARGNNSDHESIDNNDHESTVTTTTVAPKPTVSIGGRRSGRETTCSRTCSARRCRNA